MRLLSVVLSLVLFLQMTCWLPASDAAATYDPANGVKAEGVPVNKIGALLLADAVAFLNNDTIQVQTKGPNNTTQNVLTGKISDVTVSGSGASATVHGTCVFDGGTRVSEACPKGQSGCKFKFAMPMSGARISFTHVTEVAVVKPVRQPHVSSSAPIEGSTVRKIVVTGLVLCLIATAIAVPIAVAVGSKGHHHNRNSQQQALLLSSLINRRAPAPEPQVLRAVPAGPALPEPNLFPVPSGP
jgi:hypothetical protein